MNASLIDEITDHYYNITAMNLIGGPAFKW